ncbi:RNA polymerase sigma factor [Streptomyces sp. NPDC051366]|uniref:RNA polymerase sigma factor n=1 Tax=Streptomyces sp. NPDC051366 TaxID=3365652 RepID=UPI00379D2BD3
MRQTDLLAFVGRLVGDRHLAEDVVQESFLAAWRGWESLRDPERVRPWLFGIAYRQAMTQLRRPGAVPIAELPDTVDASTAGSPERSVEQREVQRLVWEAADGLDARQRSVLELAVRWEMDSAEIAEVLGVNRPHAAVLVNRSKAALGTAVRMVLVARQRGRCSGLDALADRRETARHADGRAGSGRGRMTLDVSERRSVDHHVRRCKLCRGLVASLATLWVCLPQSSRLPMHGCHTTVTSAFPLIPRQGRQLRECQRILRPWWYSRHIRAELRKHQYGAAIAVCWAGNGPDRGDCWCGCRRRGER